LSTVTHFHEDRRDNPRTPVPTQAQIAAYIAYRGQSESIGSDGSNYSETPEEKPTVRTRLPTWVRQAVPIIISAVLSACITGIVTVESIKQELAVESASVAIILADHTRRITDLEKGSMSKEAVIERDKRIDDAFKSLQEQVGRTDMNVDEIRRIIYERFGQKH
jgi:hypothetical protein